MLPYNAAPVCAVVQLADDDNPQIGWPTVSESVSGSLSKVISEKRK
jgi:hypothetical protein